MHFATHTWSLLVIWFWNEWVLWRPHSASAMLSSQTLMENLMWQHSDNTAADILYDFYQSPKENDPETECMRFIQTASRLIRNDIRSVSTTPEEYPGLTDTSDLKHKTFVPISLKLFLRQIFGENNADLKSASLGQAKMQTARPRVLLPS